MISLNAEFEKFITIMNAMRPVPPNVEALLRDAYFLGAAVTSKAFKEQQDILMAEADAHLMKEFKWFLSLKTQPKSAEAPDHEPLNITRKIAPAADLASLTPKP